MFKTEVSSGCHPTGPQTPPLSPHPVSVNGISILPDAQSRNSTPPSFFHPKFRCQGTSIASVAWHLIYLPSLHSSLTPSLKSTPRRPSCRLYIFTGVSNRISTFSRLKRNSWPYSLKRSSLVFSISERGTTIHRIAQFKNWGWDSPGVQW